MPKLIVGCGYLGERVAQRWLQAGEDVFAITRSSERALTLQAAGLRPLVGDLLAPSRLPPLPAADTILFAVGNDRSGGRPMRQVQVDGLLHTIERLPHPPERLIYISSTGVYGQQQGEWVDETSPCLPEREGGRACLAAEFALQESPLEGRAVILRLAGIYGPGRVPRQAELLQGRPLAVPADGFLNLIHVDDAADIVVLAAARAPRPSCYLVSDGAPVLRRDYLAEVARLIGAPPPLFDPPSAAAPVSQRAGSDKRVSNARLLRELGPRLQYPSYREGLRMILQGSSS